MSTQRIAKLVAPKGHCLGCQGPVPKGRRSWCSQSCVDAALIKLNPSVARFRVLARDKGVCSHCGFDAEQAGRVLQKMMALRWRRDVLSDYDGLRESIWFLQKLWGARSDFYHMPHLWEADHELPVIEGGGGCDLDNYRTLCLQCHRAETKALAARRAKTRRDGIAAQRLAQWAGVCA